MLLFELPSREMVFALLPMVRVESVLLLLLPAVLDKGVTAVVEDTLVRLLSEREE